MHFNIRHQTIYRYSAPVRLYPQLLRFHPRDDGAQRVISNQISVVPAPVGRNDHLDLEGNRITQVWFDGETDFLQVDVNMQVETVRSNAFDYILMPGTEILPITHTQDVACARAYLERINADDTVTAFAAELSMAVNSNTLAFLEQLNRVLYSDYVHIIRDTGEPQNPAHTLQTRQGACRDLSVLFADCCRAEGIPARFASGYQKGDSNQQRRYLHAWPEVYLPGAGWRGFDPTHGEAVADTHVTIAAASNPGDTMPVTGSFHGTMATSELDFTLEIQVM